MRKRRFSEFSAVCLIMLLILCGCNKKSGFLEDVQYIRVARNQPTNLWVIKSDTIIDSSDERFDIILNSLKNTEYTEYTGEVLYPIGEGPFVISFYGSDHHLTGYMLYAHYNDIIIEDARKSGMDEFWHFSIEYEPYHGNYEFVSEENEKAFFRAIESIILEGDYNID